MRYRRLIGNEPCYGQGLEDFVTDNEAVAQAILTRLRLYTNEWWEDLKDGLPLWTDIMGYAGSNKDNVNLILKDRIMQTKLNDETLITGFSLEEGVYDSATRNYRFSAEVETIYGKVLITNVSR